MSVPHVKPRQITSARVESDSRPRRTKERCTRSDIPVEVSHVGVPNYGPNVLVHEVRCPSPSTVKEFRNRGFDRFVVKVI